MNGPSMRAANRKRQARRMRPRIEQLESRLAPATFKVNTLLETVAVNLQNGQDSTGHISLESAIMAANARGGKNTIILPAGTMAADDFVIDDNLTIKGKSEAGTIINGNGFSRGFDIQGGKVTISKLTIEGCSAPGEGGAILNDGGNVELSSVQIMDNVAFGSGGAAGTIGSPGQATASNGGAGQAGGNAYGGGICNEVGSLTLVKSLIYENAAAGGTGGDGGTGGFALGLAGPSGVAGESAKGGAGGAGGAGGSAYGGGVYNGTGAVLTIIGTSITSNGAISGEGGAGGLGGNGTGGAGGSGAAGGNGTGGAGGAGGAGGVAHGGGVLNAPGGILTISGASFTSNFAAGFNGGGDGGHGGNGTGGVAGDDVSGGAGPGGVGTGGAGGAGGAGGRWRGRRALQRGERHPLGFSQYLFEQCGVGRRGRRRWVGWAGRRQHRRNRQQQFPGACWRRWDRRRWRQRWCRGTGGWRWHCERYWGVALEPRDRNDHVEPRHRRFRRFRR